MTGIRERVEYIVGWMAGRKQRNVFADDKTINIKTVLVTTGFTYALWTPPSGEARSAFSAQFQAMRHAFVQDV